MAGSGQLVRQLVRFLMGSCLGLVVDLALFEIGVRLGAAPGVANTISAGSAVIVVYLFITKYAFTGDRTTSSFLLFVAWYVTSIVVFSVLIEVLHGATGWTPFLCKLVSLPFSFAANFGVSKVLFRSRRGSDGAGGALDGRTGLDTGPARDAAV
jgi:putative flippase GtrA